MLSEGRRDTVYLSIISATDLLQAVRGQWRDEVLPITVIILAVFIIMIMLQIRYRDEAQKETQKRCNLCPEAFFF